MKKLFSRTLQTLLSKYIFAFAAALFVASTFIGASLAFATGGATVTPATGGENISIDTTFFDGHTGTPVELSTPVITETNAGDIRLGTHTISLPSGWEFDVEKTIAIKNYVGNIEPANQTAVFSTDKKSFTFSVSKVSTKKDYLAFTNIYVRPISDKPSSGEMTYSGPGLIDTVNFGALSTIPGKVTKLAFITQPTNTIYGSTISTTVVNTQDQFGNNSTNGLAGGNTVTLANSGTGILFGANSIALDAKGTATFADLRINAVGEKTLIASATGIASATSNPFGIIAKTLTVAVTANNKTYDGNESATFSSSVITGIEFGDAITVFGGTATFDTKDVGTAKNVAVKDMVLAGDQKYNYFYNGTASGSANITAAPVTVVADAKTKIYGDIDPALTYVPTGLIGADTLSGGLSRATGEDVATYAIGLGTLNNLNYAITYTGANLSITPRPVTVSAVSDTKTYDGGVFSLKKPTLSETLPYGMENPFVQTFNSKNIDATKVNVTPIVNSNYTFTYNDADGTVIAKELTVTGLSATSKDYDGSATATVTGTPDLVGKIGTEEVVLSGTAVGTFNTENAGATSVAVSGLSITGTGAGNYTLTQPTLSASISKMPVMITPISGQTKIYGDSDPVFGYTHPVLISTDDVTGALSRVAGESVGTYAYTLGTLTAGDNYALSMVSGPSTFAVTKKSISITATGINKVYDGNTTAEVTLIPSGIRSGDLVTFGYTATFDTKDNGTEKTVSVTGISITGGANASEYELSNTVTSTTASITKAPITVSFTTVENKTYNGDNSATIHRTSGLVLSGIVAGETVGILDSSGVATFSDKHTGNGKTVTATGFVLNGTNKDNYEITKINTTTGNIIPRPITVTSVTDSKEYNGTNISLKTPEVTSTNKIVSGDIANFTQSFDTRNVGALKVLTATGFVNDGNGGKNYGVKFETVSTGSITARPVTVTAQNDSKTYDGGTSSDSIPIVGTFASGDTVGIVPIQVFADANVGTVKTLKASGLIVNDGFGGANYSVNYVDDITGEITAKSVTVDGAKTTPKTYDGNDTATIDFTGATLNGLVNFGNATLVTTGSSATFDNKNVGTGKTVTVSGITLGGTMPGNYSLTQPVLTDGVITPKTLTVTATGKDKVYDATPTAEVTLSSDKLSGDGVMVGNASANFADANIGTKSIKVSGISLTGGADKGNYVLASTEVSTTGTITAREVEITPIAGQKKVYGTEDPVFGYTVGSNFLDGTFTGALSRDEGSNVGTYAYLLNDLSAGSNYSLKLNSGTFEITKAPLTVTAENKIKIGTTADPALTYTYTGLVNGDTTATFVNSLKRVAGEANGTYSINQDTLEATGNYAITKFNAGTLTIKETASVVSHTPGTNDGGVDVKAPIVITFTEPVLVGGGITLTPATAFTMTNVENVVTLTPTTEWTGNTEYEVTVTKGVTDVNGLPLLDATTWKFTTAVKYSIPLVSGWNLISLPVIPASTATADVLESAKTGVKKVWAYDATKADNATGGWSVYNTDENIPDDLASMVPGYGYWVEYTGATANLTGSGTLIKEGASVPPSRKLAEGWNLIGYYQRANTVSVSATNALYNNLNGFWTLLFTYDNTNKQVKELTGISKMNPGEGFWIWLDSAKSYTLGKTDTI